MYKLTYIVILSTVLLLVSRASAWAQIGYEPSAQIKAKEGVHNFDYRVSNLKNYLELHKSPLSGFAGEFVRASDQAGIDYRLVAAITGVESTFGKRIPKNSYNAYGWANGEYKFHSWEDSIWHVTITLREKYIDSGATTIAKIARRYAPPSQTWGKNVRFFMKKIDRLPLEFSLEG